MDEKSILEEQDIERNYRNLIGKSSDTWSHIKDSLLGHTSQDRLLVSELSLSLREVRFSEQKFLVGKPVLDIKYYHPSF